MGGSEFFQVLKKLAKMSDRVNETELRHRFFEVGFFSALGYGSIGEDIRLEQITSRGRVDVLLRAFTSHPVCLIEFKNPRESLATHVQQLRNYIPDILPEYAALTNGREFWLYKRQGLSLIEPPRIFNFERITEDEANELYLILCRREVNLHDLSEVLSEIESITCQPICVTSPEEVGGKEFLNRFALSRHAVFGRLCEALLNALPALLQHRFTSGAYNFWRRFYARELDIEEVPKSWRELVQNDDSETLNCFMFVLETAYALMARIILAKAMQDAGFPHLNVPQIFANELCRHARRERLDLRAYLSATKAILESGSRQAFASLFASDIFDWWEDTERLKEPDAFCTALAEAVITVFAFDFSQLSSPQSGDLLGILYQRYFDPETRKALGEFYTPPEIVAFILDEIGYTHDNPAIRTARLLDPACGSGTFLIHAIRRFIAANSGREPEIVLRELVDGLRIVGFDIHPFACLMAQVNYAAQILPLYAQAIRRNPDFMIHTLPILRTDSLRMEDREEKIPSPTTEGHENLSLQLEYEDDYAVIRTQIPIQVNAVSTRQNRQTQMPFLNVAVPVPRYDRARELGLVRNAEEYFAAVRFAFEAAKEEWDERQLSGRLKANSTSFPDPTRLARFLMPAIKLIKQTIDMLRRNYDDGRFFKTLQDIALAVVLKNGRDLRFQFVVMNPPYIRIQRIPEAFRRYWERLYTWAEGNYDAFIPFVERALTHWLEEGGKLGCIVSNRFLQAGYAEKLRTQLPQKATLQTVVDFRAVPVFYRSLAWAGILVAYRQPMHEDHHFAVVRVAGTSVSDLGELLRDIRISLSNLRSGSPYSQHSQSDAFLQTRKHLKPSSWLLMPDRERKVFEAIESAATHRLEELTITRSGGFQGLATGCDSVFILKLLDEELPDDDNAKVRVKPLGGGNEFEIERGVVRPWLFGRDVERWHINWDKWLVLFPYAKVDDPKARFGYRYVLYPSRDYKPTNEQKGLPCMEDAFPLAWRYLKRSEQKLREREHGRFRRNRPEAQLWYGFSYPKSMALYERRKVLVQALSSAPNSTLDERGYAFQAGSTGGGVYGIAFDEHIDLWLMLGTLNSNVLDFYLKHISMVFTESGSYSYSDAYLRRLPLKLPCNQTERKKAKAISHLAQELTELKGELRATERKRENFPDSVFAQIRAEFYSLERLATEVYIPANTISVSEPSLKQDSQGNWTVSLNNRAFVKVPTKAHAEIILAWLKVQGSSNIHRNDLLALHLPATEVDCCDLLKLLRDLEESIQRLQGQIATKEDELNDRVADYYGLNNRQRRILTDFLSRFSASRS